jgi:hypothetical protein
VVKRPSERLKRYPFQAGGTVSAEYFWDREDERERVRHVYQSGSIAVLSGWRRMGKTSLAAVVGTEMEAAGQLRWGILNVRETTASNFASKLLAKIFQLREGHRIEGLFERAVSFARSLRVQPAVEADPVSGGVSFKFEARRTALEGDDAAAVYHDSLSTLEGIASEGTVPVALVLDEFQDVMTVAPLFPEVLKSRASGGHSLALLLMGSSEHLMTQLVGSPSAPLYRIGAQIWLGPLPVAVVIEEVRRRFGWNGIATGEDAARQVYELCAGVTQDIQLLCGAALEHALRQGWQELTAERLRAVMADVVEQNIDRFVDRWNQLTAIQRDVLVAVAEFGGQRTLSKAFLRRINPADPPLPATVRRALMALVDKELLEASAPEGYRFKDPLLAYYARELVGPSSVR